jgi:hypothetical protein
MFLLGTSATPAAHAAAMTLHYMELLRHNGAVVVRPTRVSLRLVARVRLELTTSAL